ncbi:MAG: M48 family metalloprotease [bacterium]|nr:M48 family metalloprotease [bacterium]
MEMQVTPYGSKSGWAGWLQSAVLLAAMAGLLGITGFFLGGEWGLGFAALALLGLFFTRLKTPLRNPLERLGAIALAPTQAPQLYWTLTELCRRAEVPAPRLYFQPTSEPNAFTLGQGPQHEALVLTQGLFEHLDQAEIEAVMAHEVAHLKNRDLGFLYFAQLMGRLTEMLAFWGQWMVLLALPFFLKGQADIPWLGFAFLVLAPRLYLRLLMAFSRSREFLADQVAIELTGQPMDLASALDKLQRHLKRWQPVWPLGRPLNPWLQSHPTLGARIRRIEANLPPRLP